MIRYWILVLISVCVLNTLVMFPASAQDHPDGVCAEVKLEILQELTLERLAFDAKLAITNGFSSPLEDISVEIEIRDADGNRADDLFFLRVDSLTDIDAIDGTGIIAGEGTKGVIHWLIIPELGAGGDTPAGLRYAVRAIIGYSIGGRLSSITTWDDWITVYPQPELVIDYYLPRDVPGDDPFTPEIEPSDPFYLAVKVTNVGKGPAIDLAIDSAQPKIVENELGLLVDFIIIGSWVNGKGASRSLKIRLGDIAPGGSAVGAWAMTCSLEGEFTEFSASYTHSAELGGEATSLITEVNTHILVKDIIADSINLDGAFDLLVDTDEDELPDMIMETSTGETSDVTVVSASSSGFPVAEDPTISIQTEVVDGWIYAEVDEPTDGQIPLYQMIRSDGKVINPSNYWLNGLMIHLVDQDTTGQYTVVYSPSVFDSAPPETVLNIKDPYVAGDPIGVAFYTIFYLTATDDASGVAKSEYAIDDGEWKLSSPFYITEEGDHTIGYRSIDGRDNTEAPKSSNVYVDRTAPIISDISVVPDPFNVGADDATDISYNLSDNFFDQLSVTIKVYNVHRQLVRTLQAESLTVTGDNSSSWDGKDGAGGVVQAGQYTVEITARDGVNNQSISSGTVEVTVDAPPAPVGTLTATDAGIGGTVDLDWTGYDEAGQGDVDHYNIYQSEADFSDVGGMTAVANVLAGAFSYQVTGLTDGTTYYFAVTAVDTASNEDPTVITASAVPSFMGSLAIQSTPEGASVYLNGNYAYLGEYQGVTPITIPDLPAGKYVVRLVLAGYETSYSLVDVAGGDPTEISVSLVENVLPQYTNSEILLSMGSAATPLIVDWNMDGMKDIIASIASGEVLYHENIGTNEIPVFGPGVNVLPGLGMMETAAFVVDWNNDRKKDLLIGDAVGNVTFYENTGTDTEPVFDSSAGVLVTSVGNFAIPWVVDWDNDHKKDILVGDGNGNVNIFFNTGDDQAPVVVGAPWPGDDPPPSVGGNAAPCVLDWDSDGKKDLLVGCITGEVYLYLNTGTNEAPGFATGAPIKVGPTDLSAGESSIPCVLDWNNDNLKDMVIGNKAGEVQVFLGESGLPPTEPELVDAYVQQSAANVRFDRRTGIHSLDLMVTNISSGVLLAPLTAVLTDISSPSVTVANASGQALGGDPYWDYSSLLIDGQLLPGQSISKRIEFNNPSRVRFTYTIQFFAKVGE